MYVPPAFKEDRLTLQHDLIRAHPLGLLISTGNQGPLASPIPFHLVADDSTLGLLQGHLARANAQWQGLDGQDVLVVFQGADAYVTPSWYQSKTEHGKVVPTWNYVMVQARGPLRVIDDKTWLRRQIARLTRDQEAQRTPPWHVADAPDAFIEAQLKGIVGVEIAIRRLDGKWKVSQNRPVADRAGVAAGLSSSGEHTIAELVRRHGGLE